MLPSRSALPVFALLAISACYPYDRFGVDDDGLGPVDPVNFPPPNLGAGGNRKMPGNGSFTAARAFAGRMPVSYFSYPFPANSSAADPLRISEDDVPTGAVPAPPAYAFGGGYKCTPPEGYKYDRRLEERPRDVQDNVLTALPAATYGDRGPRTDYLPVVSQIPVTGPALPCQKPKSEEALTKLLGSMPKSDGKYLAWLIIDPAAGVYDVGEDVSNSGGAKLQSWGWYQRYLAAYIDGGEVPTATMTVMEGTPPVSKKVQQMVTQKLYYPRSLVISGGMMPTMAPGEIGAGYDVVEAKKGAPGYSPVCEVLTYDAGMPLPADQLPKDAATIEAMFNGMASPIMPAATPLVFCLQVVAP
jgi:hypothetical protein